MPLHLIRGSFAARKALDDSPRNQSSFVYDGQPKEPVITVKDGATTLTKGTHYLVEYKDNVNVGTAKAIVKGIEPYVGEVTNAFTIVKGTLPPDDDPDPTDPGVDPDDPGQREDPTIPFSAFDYVGMYDGEAHTIDTNALKAAYAAKLGAVTVGYSTASNGAYQATAFAFKDSAVTSFWYKVTSANYSDIVRPCKVAVTNRPVTVTSGTKLDFVYDGKPHAYTNLAVTAGSFVVGEGIATSNWATVTAVAEGQVPNAFDYEAIEGTKLANYDLTVVTGRIAVVSPDAVVVTITGHVASVTYDGTEKSVSGYDIVSISDPLYTAADFKFIGVASTNGTNAGTYPMGLKSADFVNTNANFATVVFNVTDGKLVISQAVVPPGDDPDPTDPSVDPDDPGQREDPTIPFSAFDYVGMYDGEKHTVDTNALKQAWTAAMGEVTVGYSTASNGAYQSDAFLFKDAVVTSFWYKVTSANYADIVKPCKVAVTKRSVTLTSGTEQWTYDGNAHSNVAVTVGGDGFVAGEGVATNAFSTIAEIGSAPNVFSYEFLPGTLAANYLVSCVTGTLSVVAAADPSAWGTVTYPKPMKGLAYLKSAANATWKAKAAQACVFAGWEWTNGAPEAAFLALSENERRNKSLKVKVGEGVRPTDVGATWARIDEDRIQSVELTPSNLAVVCRSYVTASMSGLPGGLKFNKKTLAITGAPKKDETKTVKVSVKNASGYTWKENWLVTVQSGAMIGIERITGSRVTTGEPAVLWEDAVRGKTKGSKVYVVGKKASLKATPAKNCIFLGWYEDPLFVDAATWLPKGYLAASQTVVVPAGGIKLFARFVELKPWAVGTFNGGGDEGGLVTLTVSAKSKVSGKFLTDGKTWKLSAAAFTDYDAETDTYEVFPVAAKCGKEARTLLLSVSADGIVCEDVFDAYRNGWKEEPLKTVAKTLKGKAWTDEVVGGILQWKVGSSGAVTVKLTAMDLNGKPYSASCSTVLIPTETANKYLVYVYFPPKAGKFGGFSNSYVVEKL